MSRRNKKAWPSFLGVRAGSGVAAASGALTLFLLASFLAVVALDVGGGPKEGTSGDQLRDYVEVRYIFNFRMGNWCDVVLFWFTVVDYIAKNEQGLVRLFLFQVYEQLVF